MCIRDSFLVGGMACAINPDAVSYTHLDVYKRQDINILNYMGTKTSTNETYLQSIERQGYSRRDFMKFVAFIGAYMGIESSALGQVAKSLACLLYTSRCV